MDRLAAACERQKLTSQTRPKYRGCEGQHLPHTCRSEHPSGPAPLGGLRAYAIGVVVAALAPFRTFALTDTAIK
jgi:hypothetical protein